MYLYGCSLNITSHITKELKETKDQAETTQEKNRITLERLKNKFAVLESNVGHRHQEDIVQLEKDNQRLQTELTKAKFGKRMNRDKIIGSWIFNNNNNDSN